MARARRRGEGSGKKLTAWLEYKRDPSFQSPAPDRSHDAIQAWNLMGGIEWNAIDTVAEMLGVEDVDLLIRQLVVIRDSQNQPEQ